MGSRQSWIFAYDKNRFQSARYQADGNLIELREQFTFLLYVDYSRLLVQAKTCKFVADASSAENSWGPIHEIQPETWLEMQSSLGNTLLNFLHDKLRCSTVHGKECVIFADQIPVYEC